MKRYLILATAGLLAMASCHKSNKTVDPQVLGDWKWVRMDYSTAQIWQTFPGQDSTIVLHLQSDRGYTITVNGHILSQGTFEQTVLKYDNSAPYPALVFDNLPQLETDVFIPLKSTYTINGDNLSMRSYFLSPGGSGTYFFVKDR